MPFCCFIWNGFYCMKQNFLKLCILLGIANLFICQSIPISATQLTCYTKNHQTNHYTISNEPDFLGGVSQDLWHALTKARPENGLAEITKNGLELVATGINDDVTDISKEISVQNQTQDHEQNQNYVTDWVEPSGSQSIMQETPPHEIDAEIIYPPEYLNRWHISLTNEEIDLLAKIVWIEARGESQEGQEAVVEVIFNRMLAENYPNDLIGVISQLGQFESWPIVDQAFPTEKEYMSINAVLYGETNLLPMNTIYFATKPLTEDVEISIGGHIFCN